MKTIVLAATKGGTGKSTVATALAVAAMKEKAKVVILDGDPQQSIGMWSLMRTENGLWAPEVFAVSDIQLDLGDLESQGTDWVFIDTAPGDAQRLALIIAEADLVVIPVRVSAFDLDAIAPAVQACEDFNKPFVFLLNAVIDTKGASYNGMVKGLGQNGPVLDQIIRQRAAYANAIALGKTGPEVSNKAQAKDCGEEIDALWQAIKKRIASRSKARR
ncbi:MAG: AAA family ATPase [Proteobacteria bacterium]|nr:AAA family ATPase [Pseudomonadota bacterium]